MPTPLEVKMKEDAERLDRAIADKPVKKHIFLRNRVTGVIFGWSPMLSLEPNMEELDEMPEENQATSDQPTTTQNKDKYDIVDEQDLRDMCEARGIALGNTKDVEKIKTRLREFDLEQEGE